LVTSRISVRARPFVACTSRSPSAAFRTAQNGTNVDVDATVTHAS
jgi:hypothetical protein